MMITLFTIVPYQYRPTPDRTERNGGRGKEGEMEGSWKLEPHLGCFLQPPLMTADN